jgi:hypothetical protein
MISTDIEDFVRHSVSNLLSTGDLVIRAPELEMEIITILTDGAKGM